MNNVGFVNVGICWTQHHHLLQAVKKVNGSVLWANPNLLLSATRWLPAFF